MAYKVGDRIVVNMGERTPYNEFRNIQNRDGYITVRDVILCYPDTISNISDRLRCATCSRIKYLFNDIAVHHYVSAGYCDDMIQLHSRLYMTPAKPKPFTIKK